MLTTLAAVVRTVRRLVRAEIARSEAEIATIFSRYRPGQCLLFCNGDSPRYWKLKRRIERLQRLCPNARSHFPSGSEVK